MEQKRPIIRLWQLHGIGLIITHPSGVMYSNQTGGYACGFCRKVAFSRVWESVSH